MTLSFNEIILGSLLHGLKRQRLIAHAAQDDDRDRRVGRMHLPDGRQAEGVRKGKIQEDGVEAAFVDVCQSVGQRLRVRDGELLHAPFREQVLGQAGIDVVVFNQQNVDHV